MECEMIKEETSTFEDIEAFEVAVEKIRTSAIDYLHVIELIKNNIMPENLQNGQKVDDTSAREENERSSRFKEIQENYSQSLFLNRRASKAPEQLVLENARRVSDTFEHIRTLLEKHRFLDANPDEDGGIKEDVKAFEAIPEDTALTLGAGFVWHEKTLKKATKLHELFKQKASELFLLSE